MQNKKILGGVIFLIVLLVGAYYLFFRVDNVEVKQEVSHTVQAAPQPEPTGKKIPFSQFVTKGGSYKCDVKQFVSDMSNSGTVYIDGSNLRGDFKTVAEGMTIDNSFILKDSYTYNWSSMAPNMGVKMKVANSSANPKGTYSWNADQIGDYDCTPWTPDQVKFTLPANVTFKEVTQ